ncbi:MAG: PDZ domain-containing protein [Planctomycetia bacterium]|nr:PDZ domain-containing protein [Planctomycetia bacterium]
MLSGLNLDAAAMDGCRLLLSSAWKGLFLLSIAGGLAWCLSRRAAAVRHMVWTIALVGALLVPVIEMIAPIWAVPFLPALGTTKSVDSKSASQPAAEAESPALPAVAMLEGSALEQAVVSQVQSSRDTIELSPAPPAPAHAEAPGAFRPAVFIPQAIMVVWLVGVILLLMRVVAGFLSLKRLERRSTSIGDHPLAAELALVARDQGIARPVRLMLSTERAIPMTWGVLRPVLLLPADAVVWPLGRLRVVLLHELAHIARFDYLTQLLGMLACACHWHNPLVWWGLRQTKREQEQACDDRVLSTGAAADAYAFELLHVTSQYPRPRFTPSAALAIGRSARIQWRLESILDDSRDRRSLSARSAAFLLVAGALIISGVAPLQAVSAEDESTTLANQASGTEQKAVSRGDATGAAAGQEAAAAGPAAATSDAAAQAPAAPNSESRLSSIREKILKSFVKSPNAKQLDEGAIRGMLQALDDPHSDFLTPEKLKDLERTIAGMLSGIGVQVATGENQLTVIGALDNSPAQAAGLVKGDAILSVDGKTVRELGATAAIEAIRGKAGTVVTLKVKRNDGEEKAFEVTRGAIRVPGVKGLWKNAIERDLPKQWQYWLDPAQKIGYLQILEFGNQTAGDCRAVVDSLQAGGLKGLVLDLRGCPGGLLQAVVDTADLFLREGTIVSIKGERTPEAVYRATGNTYRGDFPLLVIVDDRTASAAEIFAGALKDNGRATIVGMRTYGKGSVQSIIPIDAEGAIRLTTAYFYLPSGRMIDKQAGAEGWGIEPTEGFAVTLSPELQSQRVKARQEWEIYGDSLRRAHEKGPQAIASVLEDVLADLQLLVAYKCLAARLGQAGSSEQAVKDSFSHRERLLKARADAQKQIELIDKELASPRGK